ncbi:MAG TPA: DUF4124 domain-containing protein [Burkholderiales bacterium]|nr:DUF4124 domain-containing protein [Burkholderiales bacterium]
MSGFPTATGLLVTLVCGCVTALPALGELYKWTDAEGVVHYSDQPPPPNVKKPVTVKPRNPAPPTAAPAAAAAAAPAAGPKTPAEQEAEFNRRRVEAAEKDAAEKKVAKEAEEKKKNCEQAKAQLARMQTGARITRYNDSGEIEYLNDAEIAQEAVRARQVADSWCN